MKGKVVVTTAVLLAGTAMEAAQAETFNLEPVQVVGSDVHPSQEVRTQVEDSFNQSRSASYVNGSVIQNLNPVNKGDALRYNAVGLINQPGDGGRFGGGTKIRTFGDWGASESIDGLPAFKLAGEEGGGYANTIIPSIAVDRIGVLRGGRAVQYGDGTDGGVVETTIKSGRYYTNHQAVNLDVSTAKEAMTQGEIADHGEAWDYYMAGNWLQGEYNGDPENLERQRVLGGLGKFGWNIGPDTRGEFLAIIDRSSPDIIRNGNVESIEVNSEVGAATVDHKFSDRSSVRVGALVTNTRSTWDARARDRNVNNRIVFADHYLSTPLAEGLRYDGSLGLEYKQTEYQRDRLWDNTFDDIALKSANSLTVNDNLVLSAGLRHTWFSNDIIYNGAEQPNNLADDKVWSYEFGASYSVLDNTRVRGSVATGYNRFIEKYGNFGADALNANGAGDDIVESRTYELGINQGWAGGWLDVALYTTEQDGVPRRNNDAIESVKVDQSGLEVELFTRITSQLTMSAGYMRVLQLETTRADGTKVNGNIFWDGQSTSVPENQFNLRLDYHLTETVNLWGAGYYSTGYEAVAADDSVVERDGFLRLDLGAGWAITPNWAVRARVENLTDERDFGQTVKGAPVNDEGKLGRVFWLGTDITF
ncbi:TonB-dependent receptor [alpha proteobacterium BAL199]|nr:TonB-dependent receptor [alpha proteobacterium BAL199]